MKKSTLLDTDFFPELEALPADASTFDTVAALAAIAARYGHADNHQGLNVRVLLRHVQAGRDPLAIAHGLRGVRILAQEGSLAGHIEPDDHFSAAALFDHGFKVGPRFLFGVALDASSTTDRTDEDPPGTV